MTWCASQIVKFNDKIKLDSGRLERIRDAIQRLEEFCEKDDQLRAAMDSGVFLQGSVATKTVIKPLGDDEFDVDVV
jgi:Second Messenger Oligonucleotide or Dinucleotide Synthetase domain